MITIEKDIIIGIHSIQWALRNKLRHGFKLWGTTDALNSIRSHLPADQKVELERFPNDGALQEQAQKLYQKRGWNFHRIPSSLLLESSPIPQATSQDLWNEISTSSRPLKILALDRVNDVHNGAAIMRTAAFYGVDYFILSMKGHFGFTPSFFRMASGGVELLKIIITPNLSKLVTQLQEKGCDCVGFSEGGESDFPPLAASAHRCLVMGSEEEGLSNAVERVLAHKVALKPKGPLSTLNVSVATAIAMERFF